MAFNFGRAIKLVEGWTIIFSWTSHILNHESKESHWKLAMLIDTHNDTWHILCVSKKKKLVVTILVSRIARGECYIPTSNISTAYNHYFRPLTAQWLYNPYYHPLSPTIQYHALQNPLNSHKQLVNQCKKEGRKSICFLKIGHVSISCNRCKSSCNMGWAITCVARYVFFGLSIYCAHSKVAWIGSVYTPPNLIAVRPMMELESRYMISH